MLNRCSERMLNRYRVKGPGFPRNKRKDRATRLGVGRKIFFPRTTGINPTFYLKKIVKLRMRKFNQDKHRLPTIVSLLIDMIFLVIVILIMYFLLHYGAE